MTTGSVAETLAEYLGLAKRNRKNRENRCDSNWVHSIGKFRDNYSVPCC